MLFYIFANWGGRFFNTKKISENPKGVNSLVSSLISSKIILVVFSTLIIIFLPLKVEIKILIIVFLFLKSLTQIFDSLILYRKKSQIVFVTEVLLNTSFLLFIFLYNNINPISFLLYFVILELLKSVYYFTILKSEISFKFSINKGYKILKKSIYFFGISIAGFVASKADFYIIGVLIDKQTMSYYFIISSLSGISMVIYASIINTFETSIYRFNNTLFKKLEHSLKSFGLLFSIVAAFGFYVSLNYLYKIPVDIKFTVFFLINIFIFTLINFEMYRFTKLEKQNIILIILILSGIINLVFSFLLINKMGLFGAFLANTLGLMFNYLFLRFYLVKKPINEV